ncbi:MAG: hypothetical protein HQL35_14275, partial [Alphaproteobacteria bacterium]|nr:hypothetical protein [Alphaproteobacteria bacterium]
GTTTAGDDKDTKWLVAATYDLGAGVALNATYYHIKSDLEGTGTTRANGAAQKASGIIGGVEVSF